VQYEERGVHAQGGAFYPVSKHNLICHTTLKRGLRDYAITANGSKYRWSTGSSGKDLPKVNQKTF